MSILRDRIVGQDNLTEPTYHPAVSQLPATPVAMPASQHVYDGDRVLYGTLHPLVTADGAVVPAAGNVHYPDAIAAGRP